MAKHLYLESDFTQYGSDDIMDVTVTFRAIAETKISIYTDGQCYTKQVKFQTSCTTRLVKNSSIDKNNNVVS